MRTFKYGQPSSSLFTTSDLYFLCKTITFPPHPLTIATLYFASLCKSHCYSLLVYQFVSLSICQSANYLFTVVLETNRLSVSVCQCARPTHTNVKLSIVGPFICKSANPYTYQSVTRRLYTR